MKTALAALVAAITLLLPVRAVAGEAIVDTTQQLYTYARMIEDLDALQARYPEWVSYELGDESVEGRAIPVVRFGADDAALHVMVQAAMHAREYMTAQLVMALLEHNAEGIVTGRMWGDDSLSSLFRRVQFVIMPMVNPDGVSIAQLAEDGAVSEGVREWVRSNTAAGTVHDQIKSNARGVDINRNFANGHGCARNAKTSPAYAHHPGAKPYSEPETQMMLATLALHDYEFFVNYHTSGNLVYYGSGNAPAEVNTLSLELSRVIKRHTDYPLYGPKSAPPCGSWADEVCYYHRRPSVTIEIGDRNPVPIDRFAAIFDKHKDLWADIALFAINKGRRVAEVE